MLKSYKTLLTYIRSAVSRNVSEKAITNLIEKVSGAGVDFDLLKKFYDMTLDALLDIKNDRFWFKTKLKVGKLYSDREQYDELEQVSSFKSFQLHRNPFLIYHSLFLDYFRVKRMV